MCDLPPVPIFRLELTFRWKLPRRLNRGESCDKQGQTIASHVPWTTVCVQTSSQSPPHHLSHTTWKNEHLGEPSHFIFHILSLVSTVSWYNRQRKNMNSKGILAFQIHFLWARERFLSSKWYTNFVEKVLIGAGLKAKSHHRVSQS
jgi:hypothetical protein